MVSSGVVSPTLMEHSHPPLMPQEMAVSQIAVPSPKLNADSTTAEPSMTNTNTTVTTTNGSSTKPSPPKPSPRTTATTKRTSNGPTKSHLQSQPKPPQQQRAKPSQQKSQSQHQLAKPPTITSTSSRITPYSGPKLFAKPTLKTNLVIIQNAILKCLEGAANAESLKRVQASIANHSESCNHFLILFRSRQQFRGLYEYNEKAPIQKIIKLDGVGPRHINEEDIVKYFKYDSPKRQFTEVQTKHISLTIIAFTIQDHLWMKPLSARASSKSESQPQSQPIS